MELGLRVSICLVKLDAFIKDPESTQQHAENKEVFLTEVGSFTVDL